MSAVQALRLLMHWTSSRCGKRFRAGVGAGVVGRAHDLLRIAGQLVAVDLDLALLADEDRAQARPAVAVECSFNSVPLANFMVTLARGPASRAMP